MAEMSGELMYMYSTLSHESIHYHEAHTGISDIWRSSRIKINDTSNEDVIAELYRLSRTTVVQGPV